MIGEKIGSYLIVREIGAGGMGSVYEAVHKEIGRRVAIKVLLPDRTSSPLMDVRFLNEARAISMVEHPGLVTMYEYGKTSTGAAFLVMEYLAGETLRARLRRSHAGLGPEAVGIVRQLASALAATHAKHIVHRDLKPDNVMLLADVENSGIVRAKILDFGIAKLMHESALGGDMSVKTQTGSVLGTPTYMAPEQCRGTGPIDERADVYSLGIIFYELLCGRPPFRSMGFGELVALHLFSPPRPLSTLLPTLPVEISTLVHQMLAKRPSERPSAEEVASRLTRLANLVWSDERPPIRESANEVPEEDGSAITATAAGYGFEHSPFDGDPPQLSEGEAPAASSSPPAPRLKSAPSAPALFVTEPAGQVPNRRTGLILLLFGLSAIASAGWIIYGQTVRRLSAAQAAAATQATPPTRADSDSSALQLQPSVKIPTLEPTVSAAPGSQLLAPTAELDEQERLAAQALGEQKPTKAIRVLRQIVQLAPRRASALGLLCQAYYAAQKLQPALVTCQRALSMEPSQKEAQKILSLIKAGRKSREPGGAESDEYKVDFFK